MFTALAQKGINIEAIATSEIKISVLIDAAYTELAVRTLHSLFGLDEQVGIFRRLVQGDRKSQARRSPGEDLGRPMASYARRPEQYCSAACAR